MACGGYATTVVCQSVEYEHVIALPFAYQEVGHPLPQWDSNHRENPVLTIAGSLGLHAANQPHKSIAHAGMSAAGLHLQTQAGALCAHLAIWR